MHQSNKQDKKWYVVLCCKFMIRVRLYWIWIKFWYYKCMPARNNFWRITLILLRNGNFAIFEGILLKIPSSERSGRSHRSVTLGKLCCSSSSTAATWLDARPSLDSWTNDTWTSPNSPKINSTNSQLNKYCQNKIPFEQ